MNKLNQKCIKRRTVPKLKTIKNRDYYPDIGKVLYEKHLIKIEKLYKDLKCRIF